MDNYMKLLGWVGMLFIHSSTLPSIYNNLFVDSSVLPPISLIFMVWFGLILFFIYGVYRRDLVYSVSNAIGIMFNSIVLVLHAIN